MPEEKTDIATRELTDMELAARAFAIVGWLVNLNGRRLEQAYLSYRARLVRPEQGNSARTTKMLGRAERRLRLGELRASAKKRQPTLNRKQLRDAFPFRPVYGHGLPAPDHKEAIASMKTMNHETAQKYRESQEASK